MRNIWIGADWHLWSKENNASHPYRTTSNIDRLFQNYAETVKEDDILIVLGDITDPEVCDYEKLRNGIQSIPGTKILCRGNHDTESDDWYYTLGFKYVCEICLCYLIALSHFPIQVDHAMVNIHAHLHTEKIINSGYQHINAYAALHHMDPDMPVLLEDILDSSTMVPEDLNDLDHAPPTMKEARELWGTRIYRNVLDISDMISLSPLDESIAPSLVSLSAEVKEDEDDVEEDDKKLNEILFPDIDSTRYFEADDDAYSGAVDRAKYGEKKTTRMITKNDVAADGDSTMDEAARARVNDKGERVPETCPKCGFKIGVYLHGEPVYLCSNPKCKTYYGTVPFKNESVVWSECYNTPTLVWSTPTRQDALRMTCTCSNYLHEAHGIAVQFQLCDGKDFRDELGLPRSYCGYGDDDTLVLADMSERPDSVINQVRTETDAKFLFDMINNHVRVMETAMPEYSGPDYVDQSSIDAAWNYIYEEGLDPSVYVGTILDEMAYEDYCDHYYAELKRIVAKYNKDGSIKKKMAKLCEVDEADIPDFSCEIAHSGEKQLAFVILSDEVDEIIRINMERYLRAMCKELEKCAKDYPATGSIWTADGDGVIYVNLKFDGLNETVSKSPETGDSIRGSYQFELMDDVVFDDPINEASTASTELYPVYVVLVHSGTMISKAIKSVSHSEFSHASISFDSSLKKMYSFARKDPTNFLIGGFRYETIGEGFYKDKKIPYAVYVVPCTKAQVDAMKRRLNYFTKNKSRFKFDFVGLVKNYLSIVDNPEYKWFCSRFVADILNAGSPSGKKYVAEPSLQDPDDFKNMEEAIYAAGGHDLMAYDKALVDRRTKVILNMAKRGKMDRTRYQRDISESTVKHMGKRGVPTYEKPAGVVAYDMTKDEEERIAQKYGIHTSKSQNDRSEFSDKYDDPEKKKARLKEERRLALERARKQKKKAERRKALKSKLPWVKNECLYSIHETDDTVDNSDMDHYSTDTVENDDLRGRRKEFFQNREMPQEDIDKPIITPTNETFQFLRKMTESVESDDSAKPAVYVLFARTWVGVSFTPTLSPQYQCVQNTDQTYRIRKVNQNQDDIPNVDIVALEYNGHVVELLQRKVEQLCNLHTPLNFSIRPNQLSYHNAQQLISDLIVLGDAAGMTEDLNCVQESVFHAPSIADAKRAANVFSGYCTLKRTPGVYDFSHTDPYLYESLDHMFAYLDESAITNLIRYMKSFKLHFDPDGNIIIHRREYDKLRIHFNESLRLIRASEKADNAVGVKEELAKIHYMIQLIDHYFVSTPASKQSTVKTKDMIDLRAVMINVFQQHMKWVTVKEPNFNFQNYYEGSKYGSSLTIPKATLHTLGKTFVTLLS